jgi:hypothetical protein
MIISKRGNVLLLECVEDIAIRDTCDDEFHVDTIRRQLIHHPGNRNNKMLNIFAVMDGIKDNDDWSRERTRGEFSERRDEQLLKLVIQSLLRDIRLHVERAEDLYFELPRTAGCHTNLVCEGGNKASELGRKHIEDATATEEEASE